MLKEIIENKRKEVELAKKSMPLDNFRNKILKSSRDFKKAISKNKLNLIAEFKKKSPSKNISNLKLDKKNIKKSIIKVYTKYADAISVLTDGKFFSGSLDEMKEISGMTHLPILRKDFIIDEYQIHEARFYNADAVLLIASILSKEEIMSFLKTARNYGMHCLVEIHNEEELKKALDAGAEIIGINNRNLDTLEIDLGTTLKIAGKIPTGKIIVSESGIKDKYYVDKIKDKVNAILVGSKFMNSKNIENEILKLIQ